MKIHLIHGIHTSEGNHTIERLIPYVQEHSGVEVVYHRYGFALALTTGLLNPGRIRKIAESVDDGDVCIGHSNGCAIIYGIMKLRNLSGAVFINAALDVDVALPNSLLKWVHVYYNSKDEAVPLTEMPVLDWVFDHSWGEMGKYGYKGKPDPRVTNIDCESYTGAFPVRGHSDIFSEKNLPYWGTFIGRRIWHELNPSGT